jgi:hypothetical protein
MPYPGAAVGAVTVTVIPAFVKSVVSRDAAVVARHDVEIPDVERSRNPALPSAAPTAGSVFVE